MMFRKERQKRAAITINVLLGRTCGTCNSLAANIWLKSHMAIHATTGSFTLDSSYISKLSYCLKRYKECGQFGVCDEWEEL